MAYAEVSDVEARWRTLTTAERERAGVLLEDASVRLDAACPPSAPPTVQELATRKIVSCEMVKRALAVSAGGGVGVSSVQQGAGPFQETVQFSNPSGDMYLSKADRALLGMGSQVAFTVSMAGEPKPADWWVSG